MIYLDQKAVWITRIETECNISVSFINKFRTTLELFKIKLPRFWLSSNQIFAVSSIKRSTKLRKNSKKTKSIKMKKTNNINKSKSKWLQSWSGSKILPTKLMIKTKHWWKNILLCDQNFNFKTGTKICF